MVAKSRDGDTITGNSRTVPNKTADEELTNRDTKRKIHIARNRKQIIDKLRLI